MSAATKTLEARLATLEARRASGNLKPVFLDESFKAQSDFIRDPSRMKAALCTRGAGKSMGCALYLLQEAWENPGSVSLYLALTRESAKRILWGPCLKAINRKLQLGLEFNETSLTCTLPNGSIIYLHGADADAQESEKFLGQEFRLVVIDEAASFRQDLDHIVYAVLKPRMGKGTIVLIGTPSNRKGGLFYRVTTGQTTPIDSKWTVHRWSQADNPYMREQFAVELAEIKKDRPLFMETPRFKQHYLGQWEIEETGRVYRYDPDRNAGVLPPLGGEYSLVLGVDLGHSPDPSAFTLVAYGPHDPVLWIAETFKKTEMDFTDVANKIKEFQRRHNIEKVIIDGANKQGVAEMCNRHGLDLTPADKRGKADFIDLMNAELIQGQIKLGAGTGDLVEEWEDLIWDETVLPKREEHAGCANHLSDATLYAWRYTYAYLAVDRVTGPRPGTTEWMQDQERQMRETAAARHRQRSSPDDGGMGDPFPGGLSEFPSM